MLRELNQSACSAPKSCPRKFRTFEKVLESSDFLRGKFLPGPELYLDPGSCGGNTPSAGPKSLPLQKISLFKCAISKLLYKLKLGKHTFRLLFMYFSEMGFMYFSEIYLKLHLSILELYLEKVFDFWLFELYLCS